MQKDGCESRVAGRNFNEFDVSEEETRADVDAALISSRRICLPTDRAA